MLPRRLQYCSNSQNIKMLRVRTAVADNQNTSTSTYMELAHDDAADLRYAMAENHHLDNGYLKFFTLDINPFVAYKRKKLFCVWDKTFSIVSHYHLSYLSKLC